MILLPTTFPIVISALPRSAAEILTAASGMLVPMATIVSPMTICGIPNLFAMPAEPSANHQSHKGKYYLHHARSPLFSDVKYIVSLYPYDTEKSTVLSYFRAKKSPSHIAIFSESNFHKLTQQNILQKVYR